MAEYDWIIAIGFAIVFAVAFFMILSDDSSGLVIFAFLNIGLGIMVYAGLAEVWFLVLSMIATIIFICVGKSSNSGVVA